MSSSSKITRISIYVRRKQVKKLEAELKIDPKKKRRRIRKILICSIALLVITVVGIKIHNSNQKDVVRVNMIRVSQKQLVETVPAEGKVIATDKEVLFSEASGMVKAVHVRLGEQVKAGQVLVELYVPDAQENLAQAQADLSKAESDLTKARSGGKSADMVDAEATLHEAESAFKLDNYTLKRAQALYEHGALAQAELDKAQSDFNTSEASLKQAQSDYKRTQDAAPQYLQSLEAAVESARIHLESAERQASGHGLVSRQDGQILSISVNPGDVIAEHAAILTISNLTKLEIHGDVPETESSKIKVGQKVQITGNAFSDTKYQGKVLQVGMELISKTQSQNSGDYLPIVVEVKSSGVLLPGYNVDLDITTAEENALVIPVEALVEQDEGNSVWLVKDGIAHLVPVKTGISDGLTIQIKSGVDIDNQVITSPPPDLTDGKKVRVK